MSDMAKVRAIALAAALAGDGRAAPVAGAALAPVLVPGGAQSAAFAVAASAVDAADGQPTSSSGGEMSVPTYAEHDYHVAHLATSVPLRVSVRALRGSPIRACAVRPRRLGIAAAMSADGSATFSVPAPTARPFYLMLDVETEAGPEQKLLVLVDAPVPPPAGRVVNIRDLGADPTGVHDSTAAIQKALDAAKGTEETVVLVPPGQFLTTDTLLVGSHTTLFLEAGAVIRSTADRAKLPPPASSCSGNLVPLMSLKPGASAVTIAGLGRLDANGFALMEKDAAGNCSAAKGWLHRRRVLDSVRGSTAGASGAHRDVAVRGVTLADSTTWTLAIEDVDGMSVEHVKVLNHKNATIAKIENDGLDLVSVRGENPLPPSPSLDLPSSSAGSQPRVC